MKFSIFLKTICVVQMVFVFAQNVEAQSMQTLPLDSFTLVDADGGDGEGGNNLDIYDGTIFMDSPQANGTFATPLFLRERLSMTQGDFEVRAVLNFDLSSITAITGARLEFTAYSLNDTGNFTVGRVVGEDGEDVDFDTELADPVTVTETFPGPRGVASYSIDVTSIVSTWVADPTTNFGFRIQLDNDINDGIGFFDGTATQINDGANGMAPIPDDFLPMQLVLELEAETVILGDVNQDGVVDFLDIAPFIELLSSGEFQAEADIDMSSTVDFLDIAPFIGLLSTGG